MPFYREGDLVLHIDRTHIRDGGRIDMEIPRDVQWAWQIIDTMASSLEPNDATWFVEVYGQPSPFHPYHRQEDEAIVTEDPQELISDPEPPPPPVEDEKPMAPLKKATKAKKAAKKAEPKPEVAAPPPLPKKQAEPKMEAAPKVEEPVEDPWAGEDTSDPW